MFSFFNTSPKLALINGITNLGKPRVSSYIYRDELDKSSTQSNHIKGIKDEAKPMLRKELVEMKEDDMGLIEDKGQIKVKVLMTKKEAARLLAKCKNGGLLDFKDVACELVQIPTNRVSVSVSVSVVSFDTSDPVLESIPEQALKYD